MKFILLTACILGIAFCAPSQKYMEFDIHHAPAQAAMAIPAGVPAGSLEVLLPVDDQRQLIGGPVRGFIKQDIPQPNGKDEEIFYPFGFNMPDPAAPAAPAAPAVPAAPLVPVVAAAPAAPVAPAAPAAAAPAAKPSDDDEEEEDD
ncbi:secretory calcium-binding phosphoprotein 7 [Leuresthes tenuis]|uniref:secretory calcium-binding phosphoprotein 7 n=1 Tax=Leuresthes tenuis TaxID=355514 RepID=UPI003B501B3C